LPPCLFHLSRLGFGADHTIAGATVKRYLLQRSRVVI
jgi:myosin heavy subunit